MVALDPSTNFRMLNCIFTIKIKYFPHGQILSTENDNTAKFIGRILLPEYYFFLILVASEGLYFSLHIYMFFNDNQHQQNTNTYFIYFSLHLS